jgi:Na+-transporting NADH:ubiquinone oxidoreductase subunit C
MPTLRGGHLEMSNDSTSKTLIVAACLCVACSVLVSTAAVLLKPTQVKNKRLDVKKNLLLAAGLIDSPKVTENQIKEAFEQIETKLIDLSTGKEVTDMDSSTYDLEKADKDPSMATSIPRAEDIARIKMRAKVRPVYLVKESGKVSQIILPFHGKGLWSTMYGFLSLAPDTKTVKGIGFYQHGETPGLGGEIDNKKWQASWQGKKVLSDSYKPTIDVIKGSVDSSMDGAISKIDGLSGATLTSNGVEASVNYWLSNGGYGKFLAIFRAGGV